MNERRPAFTVKEGIAYQSHDLRQWKTVLNKTAYLRLVSHIKDKNSRLTDKDTGYDVFRGQDLLEFVIKLMAELSNN